MLVQPTGLTAVTISGGLDIAILVAKIVLAYLLGSLSGSLLVGRLRGLDIRKHGSGNAGGTNALRVAGWKFALSVVVIDVGKGALAVLLAYWLPGHDVLSINDLAVPAMCGFAAVLGHCWPIFFGFRGGKGAGTAIGAILVMAPLFAGLMFVVWISVVAATRYVGLATVAAALSFPCVVVAANLLGRQQGSVMLLFSIGVAVLLVFTHRSNLLRLLRNEEPRLGQRREPG
ncbi:glycerol-3-phosphate 1-O-acyltransferase PlsY [Dokdonella sp.]|uniref:glycerol-3-phosphate 1-O-acyltransferase PlsY n=1 Tax=Dokdonella sp. TaxID=2291710 RepID=UPI003C4B090C